MPGGTCKDKTLKKIIALSFSGRSLQISELKTMRNISKICFRLDKRFRTVTTSFYLRLSGVSLDFRKALDIDFLEMIALDQPTTKHLDLLVEAALTPSVL